MSSRPSLALLASLALLLASGCSSAPAHPFELDALDRLALKLGERLQAQTAAGWPERVPLDGTTPRVRIGDLSNRTDLAIEPRAFMHQLGDALEDRGYASIVGEGDRAALVLRAKLDELEGTGPRAGRYRLTGFVEEAGGGGLLFAAAVEVRRREPE